MMETNESHHLNLVKTRMGLVCRGDAYRASEGEKRGWVGRADREVSIGMELVSSLIDTMFCSTIYPSQGFS